MTIKMQQPLVPILDMRIAQPMPKITDAHYRSEGHRQWAREVIRRAGYMCQAPNCETPKRGRGRRLFADHIIELKDGGAPLDLQNGQALCGSCHAIKTAACARARGER